MGFEVSVNIEFEGYLNLWKSYFSQIGAQLPHLQSLSSKPIPYMFSP